MQCRCENSEKVFIRLMRRCTAKVTCNSFCVLMESWLWSPCWSIIGWECLRESSLVRNITVDPEGWHLRLSAYYSP